MFCIHVPISDMSGPAMNSWKLRCCKARKRVGTGGLTALRSLFKIFSLHSWDAENPNMSRCRETRRVVNAVDRKERTRLAFGKLWRYSFGGSGAPPTCGGLKSLSVALSSSFIPRVHV